MASFRKTLLQLSTLAVLLPQINAAVTVKSTILVLAREANATYSGTSILEGYGIPYLVVDLSKPASGYPQLNSTPDAGNFGGIVTVSARDYKANDDWKGALSEKQWKELYTYQEAFGVRMVRLNAWPSTDFGVQAAGNPTAADQPIAVSDTKQFLTANLVA